MDFQLVPSEGLAKSIDHPLPSGEGRFGFGTTFHSTPPWIVARGPSRALPGIAE
jgi:hypothetical protein